MRAIKERPILFSGPMVRAIIEGKKTQTRRVIKPQPELAQGWELQVPGPKSMRALAVCWDCMKYGVEPGSPSHNHRWDTSKYWRVPYGVPGDRLWVRETWCAGRAAPIYRASCCDGKPSENTDDWNAPVVDRWVPSIHMPRRASRLTLEITDIRVERLQNISEQDAKAEGVADRSEFTALWKCINGDESWSLNPWAWVVEFKIASGATT